MNKVYLSSTDRACFPNRLDLNKIKEFLKENNWQFVEDYKDADLILLGTCAYEKSFEDATIARIKEIQYNKKSDARFVVWGCLPKINKERLEEMFDGEFLGPGELCKLNKLISAKKKFEEISDANCLTKEDISTYFINPKISSFFKPFFMRLNKHLKINIQPFFNYTACTYDSKTFYLRVSEGCLNRCSYCAIKNARGDLKSKPLKEVVKEFRSGLNKGHKEFALVGQDIGCYGQDIKTNLVKLLKYLVNEQGDYKIHILFMEPRWLVKQFNELKDVFKSGKIQSINLSVQSGSNKVLRLMNRHYDIEEVARCVREIKKEAPWLIMRSHLMVGFPGETEEDFEKTYKLMDEFDLVNGIFMYSKRANTPAASFKEQVPENVKKQRHSKLYRKMWVNALKSIKIEKSK